MTIMKKSIALGLTLGVLVSLSAMGSAHAAPPHGRPGDRDWHAHEVRAHGDWHRGPHYRPGPGVVYAPPVVYSPPPPVESPGLNLVIPLNFR